MSASIAGNRMGMIAFFFRPHTVPVPVVRVSVVLVAAWLTAGRGAAQDRDDPVVARVDATEIRRSEVDRELAPQLPRFERFPPEQAEAMRLQLEEQILQDLVGKALLANAARAEGLAVTDQEMEARLAVVVESVAPGGSVESFLKEAGISRGQLVEDVRRNLLIQKLVDEKTKDTPTPTDEQLAEFFEANRTRFRQEETVECRHVFVDADGVTDPTELAVRRQKAEALRRMLVENPGLDFARVSREKSDGPTAENGGYLGFMREGDFLPEFTQAAFAQEVGEVGPVVQTQMGFHIIKVESREPARQPELEEIRDRLREVLLQQARGEVMRRLIDEWRRVAKVERVEAPVAPPPPVAEEKKPGN